MNTKQLSKAIIKILTARLCPMITGSPGIGKSDVIRQVAKQFNLKVIDMRLSQCDPTDMLGFPTHDGERMTYAPPKHFPLQSMDQIPEGFDGWLLLLDEISSAPLSVQASAYKLVLDRQVGEHDLHKNVAICCAGNKETDGAIVNRMGTAMQSRLIHLELDIDVPQWLSWAVTNDIDHRIMGYIEGRPGHLHNFDPDHDDKTFACPRTWEFASKILKQMDEDDLDDLLEILSGTLSVGVAHEFTSYLRYCTNLPSIGDLIRMPTTVDIPTDPSMLYATGHMIAAYLDAANAPALMQYVNRLPVEFGTMSVRTALKRNKSLFSELPIKGWADTLAEDLFSNK